MCRNYLLCSHPHGVLSAGAFCCFATEGTNFSEASCFVISISRFSLGPFSPLHVYFFSYYLVFFVLVLLLLCYQTN